MKNNLSISLIFLVLFFACTNKRLTDITPGKSDYPIKINLIEAMSNQKDTKLSEIADSIVYIPLKDRPVGTILNYKYFPNNIFIQVGGPDQGFLRFDGTGKFLNRIGTMGRGPEEYTGGSRFSAIDNPERFYILCNFVPRRLLEFDYNGNFLSNVLTAYPSVGSIEAISSESFLFLASSDTSFHYLANLKDRNNKSFDVATHPLLSNPNHKDLTYLEYPGARSGTYYDRLPLFWDELSMDTIYSVSKDSIYPKYILDKGTEGAPFEKLYSRKSLGPIPGSTPERWNYLLPIGFNETFYDVFIMATFKNKEIYLFTYNKASKSLSSMKTPFILPDNPKEPVSVHPKFENDIDGGISVWPGKPNSEGDVWTFKYDAMYFKKLLTKEHFQNSKALYPEKKDDLIRLVDSINEFDNPIIVAIYLKKNF